MLRDPVELLTRFSAEWIEHVRTQWSTGALLQVPFHPKYQEPLVPGSFQPLLKVLSSVLSNGFIKHVFHCDFSKVWFNVV